MTSPTLIRLTRALYEQVKADLLRPHPFGSERVGFLFMHQGIGPEGITLLFPTEYLALPDEKYVEVSDWRVGAAISGAAIRGAMQRVLDAHLGALHVHLHPHLGRPRFSLIDRHDLPEIAQSLQHANHRLIHGALLLSLDVATGVLWLPEQEGHAPVVPRVSIVGYPLRIIEGNVNVNDYDPD